ncbi:response regulator [Cytophaga hutchinsonii]|uniref:Response regulator for gln (Sensor glnL) (Nitrogen regulator I, NRI) n=1 Tax=Cytophaga hutchinsonii (strain ATCC 33406 / DSM 1761 / CIP 103989 / NBRC 15051 / NCIMB 9469 / D465) TaxID=269798 RepID=A0A6N4SWD0_CYTH3|nr:response regulator [Cytophaga hutchinsonii]ABG60778.1 response regulator for gln (sensor glnL) (nitrogen regulator I, NRI) [Cytophaga hutchinsonii ATCC 33406]SFX71744.1 Response regulator receiver domain-containing protein [Cytophaga hutchinsonii ATCC 33406]
MQNELIRVMLADDDEDDRLFFKEAFDEIKIKTSVTTLNNGIELMNYLTKPDAVLPHVLFLDLNMPGKTGIDCLKEIKQIDRLKNIAIAIYSTSASDEDIEETFVQGANVYIKKPHEFSTLKNILSDVITLNWQYHTSGLNRDNFLLSI